MSLLHHRRKDCRRPSLSGTTIVVWSSVLLPPSRIAASSSSTSARQFPVFTCSIALLPPSVGRSVTIVFVWSSQILPTHHRLLSCVRRLASVSVTILPPSSQTAQKKNPSPFQFPSFEFREQKLNQEKNLRLRRTDGKGFLSATLQGFTVFDDREGVEKEFRLAIGKPENVGASLLNAFSHQQNQDSANSSIVKENGFPVPTMLIVDVKFAQDSTFVSLCIQRPQLLVALDFLLAVVEFFVPTVSSMLSYEEHNMSHMLEAVIMDQSIYGFNLTEASSEALIYVGSGKKLQFKNVVVKGGQYLDSCVLLGANSSYSVSKEDNVYLEDFEESPSERSLRGNILDELYQSNAVNNSTELIIELQE
ncbi:hypothetical protein Ahy_A03g013604 isoform A [Arachis hypogaea]|uniref:Uncharacterized protein n=1 Tax=Arachis hypogaea TaxID=3818 RepID=A0A445DVQ6_ARAHY|nr:hypothetical protein Ahy_A03g013604 isoform A [Arachis hypogaea]